MYHKRLHILQQLGHLYNVHTLTHIYTHAHTDDTHIYQVTITVSYHNGFRTIFMSFLRIASDWRVVLGLLQDSLGVF